MRTTATASYQLYQQANEENARLSEVVEDLDKQLEAAKSGLAKAEENNERTQQEAEKLRASFEQAKSAGEEMSKEKDELLRSHAETTSALRKEIEEEKKMLEEARAQVLKLTEEASIAKKQLEELEKTAADSSAAMDTLHADLAKATDGMKTAQDTVAKLEAENAARPEPKSQLIPGVGVGAVVTGAALLLLRVITKPRRN
mmetsp:Transcript_8544/g.38154  ORF Transcript_8544/g.38154 Transcript_8544/m.38154 type:complete len:201 (-) Transcript_8544:1182-1784(-)